MSEHQPCAHIFARRPSPFLLWLAKDKRTYFCIQCGYRARKWSLSDQDSQRPVHPYMTVAKPGYNTARKIS